MRPGAQPPSQAGALVSRQCGGGYYSPARSLVEGTKKPRREPGQRVHLAPRFQRDAGCVSRLATLAVGAEKR